MVPARLKTRLKSIKATPLQDRARTATMSRRDTGSISPKSEASKEEEYDTFFDYEEELSGLKSSSEQFAEMNDPSGPVIMEEEPDVISVESYEDNNHGYITMDSIDPTIMHEVVESTLSKDEGNANNGISVETKESSFKFIQCDFIKSDDIRCKRQAPKGSTICSVHKRYKEKMRKLNGSV